MQLLCKTNMPHHQIHMSVMKSTSIPIVKSICPTCYYQVHEHACNLGHQLAHQHNLSFGHHASIKIIQNLLFSFSELSLETEKLKKDDASSVAESPKPPLVKCRECRQLLDDVKMFTGDPSFAVRLFPLIR